MTTIITSIPARHWDSYGRLFVATAEQFWPESWSLVAYTDADFMYRESSVRFQYRPLPASVKMFSDQCNEKQRGMVAQPCWSKEEIRHGHSYRTDAARFCHKPFALLDYVTERLAVDKISPWTLFWLDADVVTLRRVPDPFFEQMLPLDKAIARLYRPQSYSETGWLGFRLPIAKHFFKRLAEIYLTKELFNLTQWHDSWAIDWAVKSGNIPAYDLVKSNYGNIWEVSPIRWCFAHLKGKRKHDEKYKEQLKREIRKNTGVLIHA